VEANGAALVETTADVGYEADVDDDTNGAAETDVDDTKGAAETDVDATKGAAETDVDATKGAAKAARGTMCLYSLRPAASKLIKLKAATSPTNVGKSGL
jgi:hypothetical protein